MMYLCDPAWGDARGFFYGMDMMASGFRPYRDFMFNYGPATIYFPYWLSNITGGALSFEQAYSAFVSIFNVCGFLSLFVILRSLEIPKPARPWVLGLCIIVWQVFQMGIQATPLRYVVVPVALVFLDAVARKATSKRRALALSGAAAVAVLACVLLSPEMGICGTVAVFSYGAILLLRRAWVDAIACICGALLAAGLTMLAFPNYLLSVLAFASGGSNFPIYPNLHNLALVTASLVTLPALISAALGDSCESRAPLAAALAVAGGMLLPAAFGRCDPGHVSSSGYLTILLMFPAAAAAGKAGFRSWLLAYFGIFVVASQISFWNLCYSAYLQPIRTHEFYAKNPALVEQWRKQWETLRSTNPHAAKMHWSKVLPFPDQLQQFAKLGTLGLSNSDDQNFWLARFLVLQNKLPRDYFHAYSQGAATKEQIDIKVKESRAYDVLLIPRSTFDLIRGDIDLPSYQRFLKPYLSSLLLFPVDAQVRFAPYSPEKEFVKRMLLDFAPVGTFDSFVILQRRK